eukprot:442284_1
MGAACSTQQSVYQTQPDTVNMKYRSPPVTPSLSQSISSVCYHDEIIEEFCDSIKQANENMAMFYISEYPHIDLTNVKFLHNDTCIHLCVRNKAYNIMEYILQQGYGVKINAKNADGDTALHLAADFDDIKSVKILIKYGMDINITNNNYETALNIANENNYLHISQELVAIKTQFIEVKGRDTPVTKKMVSFANCLLN